MKYLDLMVYEKHTGLLIDERHDIDEDGIVISDVQVSFMEWNLQKQRWCSDVIDLKNHVVKIIYNSQRETEDIERNVVLGVPR